MKVSDALWPMRRPVTKPGEPISHGTGAQLRLVLNQMIESKFEQLSQFLLNPEWEATNNRAEWTVRAFRHRQSPHFNLRKQESIENAITVVACLRKEAAE